MKFLLKLIFSYVKNVTMTFSSLHIARFFDDDINTSSTIHLTEKISWKSDEILTWWIVYVISLEIMLGSQGSEIFAKLHL